MSNKNGLITPKQTAGTADIEESSFFVLNRDPVVVDTLSANDVVANIVVSGISDVNDYLQLNAGILDVSAGVLRLNGVPVGGGGGSQDLSGVLANGNSAGAYTINMNNNKITNVATPTDISDCATKGYADSIATGSAANWSLYPAKQAVDISGYDINEVELITGVNTIGNPIVINNSYNLGGTLSQHAVILAGGFDTTGVEEKPVAVAIKKEVLFAGAGDEELASLNFWGLDDVGDEEEYAAIDIIVQDNTKAATRSEMLFGVNTGGVRKTMVTLDGSASQVLINAPGTLMTGVAGTANLLITGGADRIDISNAGVNITTRKVISGGGNGETIGQYNFSGQTSTSASRIYGQVVQTADGIANGNEFGKMTLSTRRGGGMVPFVVLDGSASTVTMERGITLGGIAGRGISECAEIKNTGAIDISASGTGDITMTAGDDITITATDTLALNGADVNLNCTGVTSILNINSVLGTLIASVGAVDITAGGTTAINSTGNVTIGSLGTTSIENFNLNNSVLTKVAATADLELNNISKIENTAANIDISAANVRIDNFNMNGSSLTKLAGAGDLELNNISKIFNNSAAIDISATQVNVENYQFTGSTLATGGANFTINNIGELNFTTAGSLIDSYATLNAVGTGLTDAVGFKATTLTASSGTAAAFYSDATEAQASGAIAAGAYFGGTTANNTDGEAKGLWVQTVLGGATSGTATGVEVAGTMTGATKRGFWEHSSSANVQNTFMNKVGIGADPSGVYILDVSGQANITAGVGGRANPTLTLETTSAAAPGAYLQFYHNSASPADGDRAGVMDMYANNASGTRYEVARIRTIQQDNTAGAEDGSIELWASKAGTITQYMDIDGSNNAVIINPNKNIAGASFTIYDSTGVTTNNVLMNADCSNANVMFKNYPQRYIFDICNNYTLILPNSFNTMRILAFGAGGGGGSGRKGTSSCFGGGAGAGGNGVELWYDRMELQPDASGSITLYITPGQGGAGGAAVSTAATNGNNGSAGGVTYVNLNGFGAGATQRLIPDTATSGGNGGSGGTGAAGTGGTAATFSSDRNLGSQGRAGASSSITGQPARNTTALLYNGSVYSQTGGSGAGGGIDSAGTTQYQGGIFVSPVGQKYNGLGANVNKGGAAGTAGGTPGGDGSIVTFDNITSAAVKPLAGMGSLMGGGGASIGGNGGAGGGWTYGVAGSRGDGGGGGGATGNASSVPSGAGGRGADGFVYITVW
jgi:hypothetical protein